MNGYQKTITGFTITIGILAILLFGALLVIITDRQANSCEENPVVGCLVQVRQSYYDTVLRFKPDNTIRAGYTGKVVEEVLTDEDLRLITIRFGNTKIQTNRNWFTSNPWK